MSGDTLPPFAEGIFTGDGTITELVGSRCALCGAQHFPARTHCPDDMTETETVSLDGSGTLRRSVCPRLMLSATSISMRTRCVSSCCSIPRTRRISVSECRST